MKRIVFTGPGRAELKDVPDLPDALGEHELEGRTLVSVVSPGTESATLRAADAPVHPGCASVIEIQRVGASVEGFQPGDKAFVSGPHAERARVSASLAVRLANGAPPERAVLARFFGVGMSTLTTTTARPPDRVVVTGLGLVGLTAALAFQRCGYRVLGVEPQDTRRRLAVQSGLTETAASFPENSGESIALVVECSGREDAVLAGASTVRHRGEVVLVGVPWRKTSDITAHALLHAVFHRYAVVRSGWEWEVPLEEQPFRNGSIMQNVRAAVGWLTDGSIRPAPGVTEKFSPGEAPKVYERLLEGSMPFLAPMFDWR